MKSKLLGTIALGLMSTVFGFAQTAVYTFSNCGATGANGPSQAQVNAQYSGTTLAGAVTSLSGIQQWIVPSSGNYHIDAAGAAGGNATISGNSGGLGAEMEGEFALVAGDVIKILVGQKGADVDRTASGGGGTFVLRNNVLILAAGGGGGATNDNSAADATSATSGTNDFPGGSVLGGTGGNGGQACNVGGSGANHAGAGGGYLTDGATSTASSPGDGGKSFLNGGNGGVLDSPGGFGGGGGSGTPAGLYGGGGGGGGYSGGAGGQQVNYCTPGINRSGGGGGGSYNTGTNQVNQGGVNSGHGLVVITSLTPPANNDIGIASIDTPASGSCAGTYPFSITLKNYGGNQVTSATVAWSFNGGSVMTQSFSGVLDTNGGSGSTSTVMNLGNLVLNGNTTIKVWSTMPNGQLDTVNNNDTISYSFYASDPHVTLNELTLCDGTSGVLNPGTGWQFRQWGGLGAGSAQQLTVITPGTYWITVVDSFGCQASDTVEVVAGISEEVTLSGTVEACDQTTLDCGTSTGSYQWSNNATTQTINVTQSGTYGVTVTSQDGCESTGSATVTIHTSPTIELGANQTVCVDKGESALFGVSNSFSSYTWSTGQTTNSIIITGSTGLPLGLNELWLTVEDENGCTASDTVGVVLKKCAVGVEGVSGNAGIFLSPNPADNATQITFDRPHANLEIEMLDLSGKVVKQLSSEGGNTTLQLDLNGLPQGVYMIRVNADDIRNELIRLVVQ